MHQRVVSHTYVLIHVESIGGKSKLGLQHLACHRLSSGALVRGALAEHLDLTLLDLPVEEGLLSKWDILCVRDREGFGIDDGVGIG